MVRGIKRVDQMFVLTMAAYNLESKGSGSNLFKTGNPEPSRRPGYWQNRKN